MQLPARVLPNLIQRAGQKIEAASLGVGSDGTLFHIPKRGAGWKCDGPGAARTLRVANQARRKLAINAVGSSARMRASPTRTACAPAARTRAASGAATIPLSLTAMASRGKRGI